MKANKPSNSSGIASLAPYRFEQQQVPHSYIPSRPFPRAMDRIYLMELREKERNVRYQPSEKASIAEWRERKV